MTLRVLHVVPDSESRGGIQRFAADCAAATAELCESTTLNWASNVRLRDYLPLNVLPTPLAARLYRQRFHEPVAGGRSPVDITHYWWAHAAVESPAPRTVITCHGQEVLPGTLSRLRRTLLASTLQDADAICTPSRFTRSLLVSEYEVAPERVHVVPPSVGPGRVNGPTRTGVLGSLARFVARKNLLRVIEAMQILKEEHGLEFTYVLAGDGPLRSKILASLEDSGISWRYLGGIDDDRKLRCFYPSLDAFVLPTLQSSLDVEGFGIVYLEANAAGVPVVASRTGGVIDAVSDGQSGVFVDPEDPSDIAEGVRSVLSAREAFRTTCIRWAGEFSQPSLGSRQIAVYRAITDV